jgi:hypothetical protein
MVMVFNATFNNISVISWQSVLLVKEIGVSWENHWPAGGHWRTLACNVGTHIYELPAAGHWRTVACNVGTHIYELKFSAAKLSC